jgi:hypothetical protein
MAGQDEEFNEFIKKFKRQNEKKFANIIDMT